LGESQNKNWDGCPLFFIRGKDQDIERLKRGGCYEREKQRGKGKQEGAAEKPQREEKDKEGEEEQVGLEEALGVTSSEGVQRLRIFQEANYFFLDISMYITIMT
jgi:hypothetical protein